jgi:hypothetical protein
MPQRVKGGIRDIEEYENCVEKKIQSARNALCGHPFSAGNGLT